MLYTPTVGIVCLAGHANAAKDVLPRWIPLLDKNPYADFVFVETGTKIEQAMENRNECLNAGVKRHWVPLNGKYTRVDGRNYGASYVQGEYLWFVDGDCVPNVDAFTELQNILSPEVVISGRIKYPQPTGEQWDDHRLPHMTADVVVIHNPWFAAETSFCLSRQLFLKAEGWNVDYAVNGYCAEGAALYWRCFIRNMSPLLLARNVVLTHIYHPPTPEKLDGSLNWPVLRDELIREAKAYNMLEHPRIQYLLDAFAGDMLDGR